MSTKKYGFIKPVLVIIFYQSSSTDLFLIPSIILAISLSPSFLKSLRAFSFVIYSVEEALPTAAVGYEPLLCDFILIILSRDTEIPHLLHLDFLDSYLQGHLQKMQVFHSKVLLNLQDLPEKFYNHIPSSLP